MVRLFSILLIFAGLCLVTPPVAEAARPTGFSCASLLTKAGNLVVSPFRNMRDGWKVFHAQRKEQGPIRWLLAPRFEGKEFNKASLFNPVELPFEIYNAYTSHAWGFPLLTRPSRWVTFPIINALWIAPIFYFAGSAADSNIRALENNLREGRYGAAYVTDWIQQGELELAEGTRIIMESQKRFLFDLEPLRLRAESFNGLKIWNDDQKALANQILDGVRNENSPGDLIQEARLKELLGAHPLFQQLQNSIPPEFQFSIELWVQPEIRLADKSESEWLALLNAKGRQLALTVEQRTGLESLAANNLALQSALPLTTLALMTARTVSDPGAIEGKVRDSVGLGIPAGSPFLYRADFPIFQSEQTLHELSGDKVFDSELELWSLVYGGDPRFAGLKELIETGSASEFGVLYEVSGRLQDLNRVNAMYGNAGADPGAAEFCPLIYGEKGGQPNTYFVALQALHGNAWQAVFADINYDSLVEASRAETAAEFSAAIERGDRRTQEATALMNQGQASPVLAADCSLKN